MVQKTQIFLKSAYLVFIILILLLSFRIFSTLFYPLVNSDEGVIVLMLQYFKLPHDLYFWGQNRYGAMVPLLGQVPYRILGLSSLISESLTHYFILIAGYFALSSFIKSRFYKLLFAFVWFLPPIYDTDLLRNVFGLQYSVGGILFFLLNKYQNGFQSKRFPLKLLYCLILLVFLILAIWVSDLFVTSITAFLVVTVFYLFKDGKITGLARKFEPYFLIFSLLIAYFIISFMKSYVEISPFERYSYKSLNSIQQIIDSIGLLISTTASILAFRVPDFLFSVYSWCIILLITLTFISFKKLDFINNRFHWAAIFILDGLILTGVILVSNWAALNGMPRRYFVGAYISFWLAFLMLLSTFPSGKIKSVLTVLSFVTVGIGAISTVYSYKYIFPRSLRPKTDLVRELNNLGKTGIIADYWNSYSNSFADPAIIKATPFEESASIRNPDLVDSVFAQPRIVLIKDMWMNVFPDSIKQFDRILIRKDSSFSIGGCQACEYIVKRNWIFSIRDLKHSSELLSFDKSMDKDVLKIGPGFESSIYKHIVYGPYITLLKGKYEVGFDIRIDSVFTKDRPIAELDVVSDFGKNKIASMTLRPSLIPSLKDFHTYTLEFNVDENIPNVEFRIYYLGGAYLTFEKIRLRWLE